jgi:hypothetical protein
MVAANDSKRFHRRRDFRVIAKHSGQLFHWFLASFARSLFYLLFDKLFKGRIMKALFYPNANVHISGSALPPEEAAKADGFQDLNRKDFALKAAAQFSKAVQQDFLPVGHLGCSMKLRQRLG